MADPVDAAQAAQLLAIERANEVRDIPPGLHECVDCGEPISALRRERFGARRCIDCQSAIEARKGRR